MKRKTVSRVVGITWFLICGAGAYTMGWLLKTHPQIAGPLYPLLLFFWIVLFYGVTWLLARLIVAVWGLQLQGGDDNDDATVD